MTREIPFDCADYSVDGLKLSFLDSGGTKPPLHFYHANGFPVSMYLPLMIELAQDFFERFEEIFEALSAKNLAFIT